MAISVGCCPNGSYGPYRKRLDSRCGFRNHQHVEGSRGYGVNDLQPIQVCRAREKNEHRDTNIEEMGRGEKPEEEIEKRQRRRRKIKGVR